MTTKTTKTTMIGINVLLLFCLLTISNIHASTIANQKVSDLSIVNNPLPEKYELYVEYDQDNQRLLALMLKTYDTRYPKQAPQIQKFTIAQLKSGQYNSLKDIKTAKPFSAIALKAQNENFTEESCGTLELKVLSKLNFTLTSSEYKTETITLDCAFAESKFTMQTKDKKSFTTIEIDPHFVLLLYPNNTTIKYL